MQDARGGGWAMRLRPCASAPRVPHHSLMIQQSTPARPLINIERLGVYARDEKALDAAQRLRRFLDKTRIEARLLEVEGPGTVFSTALAPAGELQPHHLSGEFPDASDKDWTPDVVVALGGDGTVLRTLCLFPTVPVLAVNFGTVGFLTAGDQDDLSHMIFRLLEGDYFIEERIILAATCRDCTHDIINEVVLKGTTKMISVQVLIDGTHVHTIRGDGVIVGTPTGSTSYLLSTGASIVVPTVDVMILSGINEYRFSSRSLVLPASSQIQLRVQENTRESDIYISYDGQERRTLEVGDEVLVTRSEKKARLIFFDRHAFFRNLKTRLDW